MSDRKKIIFYQSYFAPIGGVETFAYNWCWWLRNFYDITVIHCGGDMKRLNKMSELVNVEKYDEKKIYNCDIFFRNSVWGIAPKNIKYKRAVEMRHADYKALVEKDNLWQNYKNMGIKDIVACGEYVGKTSDEVLHDHPTVIKNILLPKQETHKILKLISCTRIDPEKGWNRMLKMMEMMRQAKIKFEWDIFTDSKQSCSYEEVHFYKPRYDIWDHLAQADYTVLLSDREGLPYTVQESLQYQVPCIVTDIGGCTEMVKDGVNGYVVPLNMDFDIKKILNIPKCPEYENHALEDWLKYFEYDGIINKEEIIKAYKEEERLMKEAKVRVKALINFNDMENEGVLRTKAGDNPASEWVCTQERAEFLASKGAVQILEYIKEESKVEETIKEETEKKPKKKATKKSKK